MTVLTFKAMPPYSLVHFLFMLLNFLFLHLLIHGGGAHATAHMRECATCKSQFSPSPRRVQSSWQQVPLPTTPSCRPGRKNSVQLLHGFQFLVLHGKLRMRKCNNSERVCMRGGRGRKKAALIFKLSGFSSLRSDLIGICSQRTRKRNANS